MCVYLKPGFSSVLWGYMLTRHMLENKAASV